MWVFVGVRKTLKVINTFYTSTHAQVRTLLEQNGKRKRKIWKTPVRGRGARTEKEWVMSTEMPLLGFLAEIKTHKSTCAHTQTHATSRCWRFMRGQKNRERRRKSVRKFEKRSTRRTRCCAAYSAGTHAPCMGTGQKDVRLRQDVCFDDYIWFLIRQLRQTNKKKKNWLPLQTASGGTRTLCGDWQRFRFIQVQSPREKREVCACCDSIHQSYFKRLPTPVHTKTWANAYSSNSVWMLCLEGKSLISLIKTWKTHYVRQLFGSCCVNTLLAVVKILCGSSTQMRLSSDCTYCIMSTGTQTSKEACFAASTHAFWQHRCHSSPAQQVACPFHFQLHHPTDQGQQLLHIEGCWTFKGVQILV